MTESTLPVFTTESVRDAVRYGTTTEPQNGMPPGDAADAWPELTPIGHFDPPDFPVDALPDELCAFCAHVSGSLQVPIDLPAMLTLAAGATIFAKRLRVRVADGWYEPLNLYVAVALPPGERKSTVFRQVFRPIERHEAELVKALRPEVEANSNTRAIAEARLKKARNDAATAPKHEIREAAKLLADEVGRELRETPIQCLPKIIADDLTPEKIPGMLVGQRGRLAILSPEGDVFGDMAGRYSKTPKLGPYLKAHAGDAIRVDRVSKDRPSEHIEDPALTIGVCVQPGVVASLADNKDFGERGLTARFLYAMPRSILGYRSADAVPITQPVQLAFEGMMARALRYGHPCDLSPEIPVDTLTLTKDAHAERIKLSATVELTLRTGERLALIPEWGGKLVGAVCRIAGILHGFKNGGPGSPSAIDVETMRGAVAIGEYLIEHALGAFALMGADPDLVRARKLAGWIERERLDGFTKRDAFLCIRSRNDTVEVVDAPLGLLQTHGYIRPRVTGNHPPRPGRKPSPMFDVNPEIRAHNAHNL